MKTGKTIVELATEIQRQQAAKKDFLVDTRALKMTDDANLGFAEHLYGVGATAHDQISGLLNIPKKYYDRMLAEAPALLANNVNAWFEKYPARQMLRTLDGKARAVLSDKYRPLDNAELAEAVLPVLQELGCEIVSAEVTERRLYIKAVDKSILREIPAGKHLGDGSHTIVRSRQLHPLVTVANSEIGHGSLNVQGGTFDTICTNLATFSQRSMKKYHVGSRAGEFEAEQVYAMLTAETREANDRALWMTVRDVVRGAFDTARFDALVNQIVATQDDAITAEIPQVVEMAAQRFGFNDGERKSVLDHLIRGGDLSRFGLYNAVTRTAEDIEDYDRATEFERFGGQIVELPQTDWRQLAVAA